MENRTFTEEEIQVELDKLDWQPFSQNKFNEINKNEIDFMKDVPYFLYRTHDGISSDETATNKRILHASPFLLGQNLRFNLSKHIKNFPKMGGSSLVSVYKGNNNNKFYRDETIEYVINGKEDDNGILISEIDSFDEVEHFETNAIENEELDYKFIILGKVFNQKIAKISNNSNIYNILKTNSNTDLKNSLLKFNPKINQSCK